MKITTSHRTDISQSVSKSLGILSLTETTVPRMGTHFPHFSFATHPAGGLPARNTRGTSHHKPMYWAPDEMQRGILKAGLGLCGQWN
jgi:hypothetical protein